MELSMHKYYMYKHLINYFLEKVVQKNPSAAFIGSRQGEKMVGCFEVYKSIKNDRNRIRKRQRFCVVQCEDLKVLYTTGNMR